MPAQEQQRLMASQKLQNKRKGAREVGWKRKGQ
jgi:hypothetical protein